MGANMMTLLKHLIYDQAINAFFQNIKKNLFSNVTVIEFDNKFNKGTTYRQINFGLNGYLYQFMQVRVIRLTDTMITFEFDSGIVYSLMDDDKPAEAWDADESPITLELRFLIETI
jgi:hypothetical protein